MKHITRVIGRYRELVADQAWQVKQERREAEKLERFVARLLEWDGVSEKLGPVRDLVVDEDYTRPIDG